MQIRRSYSLCAIGILIFVTLQPAISNADQLLVEPDTQIGYSRTLFNHWIDQDGDGCDTRAEVLILE